MFWQKARYALKAMLELAALPAGARLSSAAITARRTSPPEIRFSLSTVKRSKRRSSVKRTSSRKGVAKDRP